MFIADFEKVAKANPRSLAYKVERALNWPLGRLRTRGRHVRKSLGQFHKDLVAGGQAGRTPTRYSPEGAVKKSPGGSLTERRLSKAVSARETAGKPMTPRELDQTHASIESKTKSQLHERKKRLGAHLEKMRKGPSFAMRHPFVTAGGTLLLAKHLLKDDKQGPYGDSPSNPMS